MNLWNIARELAIRVWLRDDRPEAAVPKELGQITAVRMKGGRLVVETESGVDFLPPTDA